MHHTSKIWRRVLFCNFGLFWFWLVWPAWAKIEHSLYYFLVEFPFDLRNTIFSKEGCKCLMAADKPCPLLQPSLYFFVFKGCQWYWYNSMHSPCGWLWRRNNSIFNRNSSNHNKVRLWKWWDDNKNVKCIFSRYC